MAIKFLNRLIDAFSVPASTKDKPLPSSYPSIGYEAFIALYEQQQIRLYYDLETAPEHAELIGTPDILRRRLLQDLWHGVHTLGFEKAAHTLKSQRGRDIKDVLPFLMLPPADYTYQYLAATAHESGAASAYVELSKADGHGGLRFVLLEPEKFASRLELAKAAAALELDAMKKSLVHTNKNTIIYTAPRLVR